MKWRYDSSNKGLRRFSHQSRYGAATHKPWSIAQIQKRNIDMLLAAGYRGQTQSLHSMNHRYELLSGDLSRLYRIHYRQTYGINVSTTPEQNIHNWLNPNSSHYCRDLSQCVFFYAARVEEADHFKICVATNEMRDAAWKYCHRQQVIIDGTFGVCTSRLLLWIAMGVNEQNHGVPVALFLFSAPTGNRATHAGYDTAILTELLHQWQTCLGVRNEEPFKPFVGMTDTDIKERGALIAVWPDISLLLCKFHVRQCWTNKRKSLKLNSLPPFWTGFIKQQLYGLEERCGSSYSLE